MDHDPATGPAGRGQGGEAALAQKPLVLPTPACPRKSFTDQVAQVPARSRPTVRLREATGAAVADGGRTIVQSARDYNVSWPVVAAAFTTHAMNVLSDEPEPVAVLGIDEVRRGKPCWRWDEPAASWTTTADR